MGPPFDNQCIYLGKVHHWPWRTPVKFDRRSRYLKVNYVRNKSKHTSHDAFLIAQRDHLRGCIFTWDEQMGICGFWIKDVKLWLCRSRQSQIITPDGYGEQAFENDTKCVIWQHDYQKLSRVLRNRYWREESVLAMSSVFNPNDLATVSSIQIR